MNRKEFMDRLAYLLQDIEDIEREEAIQYYNDYFDEAGKENENQIIEDLGSPEKVAAIIKAGLENEFDQDIEYSEKGMGNANYQETKEVVEAKVVDHDKNKNNFQGNADRNKILMIIIILGIIFLILPIGGGIFGVGIGFFVGLFALAFGILIGGVACLIAAIACFVKGVMVLSALPGMGLITLAVGFALVALSFGFFALAKGLIKVVPVIISGVINVIKTIIDKVGERLWKRQQELL